MEEGYCVSCHPVANPTCRTDPLYSASHFLGDPTLPETFDDSEPPLRVDPWPESGLRSSYGGTSGKAIVCLSCHSFRKGALVSGDDGAARNLLARSGNLVEWAPGGEAAYLCTGCHSASPGKGKQGSGHHPLQEADSANLATPPQPPATVTPSGRVNCDSCHRAHGAHTASGAYMLEIVKGENGDPRAIKPPIIFTPLCHSCHTADKY
jgi:hypothetical protein